MLINSYWFGRLWTPADITTALWLDAADASTVTLTSGAVSQWNDKSGNGRNAVQGTSSNRPTYTNNTLNSLAVIRFDATDDFLSLSNASGLTSATSFYFYGVRRSSAASAADTVTARPFLTGITGTYVIGSSGSIALSSETTIFIGGPDTSQSNPRIGANAANYSLLANEAEIYHAYGTSSNATYGARVNGSSVASLLVYDANGRTDPAGCNPSLTGFNIGGSGGGSNGAVVDFAELITLTSTPSLSTTQKLEGYFAWKWGLTSKLPAGHPYKSSAPTA